MLEEVIQTAGEIFGHSAAPYGSLLVGGATLYKALTSRFYRERMRDKEMARISADHAASVDEILTDRLSSMRADIFESAADVVASMPAAIFGDKNISMRLKAAQIELPAAAFLEKIDRHTKDAMADLKKYLVRDFDSFGCQMSRVAEEQKHLETRIDDGAEAMRRSLWTRLSKDVGHCEHLKTAYDFALPYDKVRALYSAIMHKLRDEQYLYEGKKEAYDRTHKTGRFARGNRQ